MHNEAGHGSGRDLCTDKFPGQAEGAFLAIPAATGWATGALPGDVTDSFYKECQDLFASYPLAADADDDGGETVRSMVLMLKDGDDFQFFMLSEESSEYGPRYSLRLWPGGEIPITDGDDEAAITRFVMKALTQGVPIPHDGSVFGWHDGGIVTALTATYTQYSPETPLPVFASMPSVDLPEAQWPPYAGEPLFGRWFWDSYKTGDVVPLAELIARTPDTIFWVDTRAILGADSCIVARDVKIPEGPTLRRGRYVYYQALQEGKPVPSLIALLADVGKVDLSPRFRQSLDIMPACPDPG
jgi:hypothetical protein